MKLGELCKFSQGSTEGCAWMKGECTFLLHRDLLFSFLVKEDFLIGHMDFPGHAHVQ